MTLSEYVAHLAESFAPEVQQEFGPLDEWGLRKSLAKCGMTQYPRVVGPEQGERCSGNMVCELCGQLYYDHPLDWRVIGYGNVPFLNILCDGRRVKL